MKETVTVLARTIPEESHKYGWRVCVGGITEANEWRRLYTFPLSKISFRKRDKIEVECERNPQDSRPESRKVSSTKTVGTAEDEEVAARLTPLVTSIARLEANGLTLGVVKPELLDIRIKVNSTKLMDEQTYLNALSENGMAAREKVKLPVEVSYVFRCSSDGSCKCAKKPHDITVIDWEVNELARHVIKNTPEKDVAAKMRYKLLDWLKTRDVYFVMGTHFQYGTWLIGGFFYPPKPDAAQQKLEQ
ncbi:hypothetical protein AUJ14_00505 [Candidatus Micrarchaeota archaeon CG1_02_55_22]|nr:MAG: hypothetical protein AUJ14_00505 [Candidatus Micrarchaeota archaeon CG1_02_55_22]